MRSDTVDRWLEQTPWAGWQRAAMTGDASARRYARLTSARGAPVILMDAPPETCGSQDRFVQMATHLRSIGLCAPEIFAWDEANGLMILEDLGDIDFASHLRASPRDELYLYEAAVDTLLHIGSQPPPRNLPVMTPTVGANMLDIAFDWATIDDSVQLASDIKGELKDLLTAVAPVPATLSLRDFHAENLIWRPERHGNARVGLLDFQDAFITHPAYDLASLLRDARRDVDPALVTPLLARLGGGDPGITAFHVLAVQRNLRILGIFNRLARRDGKPDYLALLPRVRAHLATDLAAPALASIAPLVRRAFDVPADAAQ